MLPAADTATRAVPLWPSGAPPFLARLRVDFQAESAGQCCRHGFRIACNRHEEIARCGVWLRAALFPIAHSCQLEPELERKFLLRKFRRLPDRANIDL